MKKRSKILVILLLLVVLCGGLVTYALFRTNKSGAATINAARWNVVFKNGESEIENNFNIQLSNATWTNPLGNVASGKIAPGSQATFYITLDATNTETDVYYEAVIGNSFNDPDFEVTVGEDSGIISYSTTSGEMIKQIPITVVWNGNINDSETKNSDDLLKKAQNITIPVTITAAQKLALRYTVTFNDGFGNVLSTKKVSEGDTVGTLPANPTKIGYTFNGWYDDPTNGNEVTSETLASQGMNIYAHWNIKYVTVSFNSNGGSSVNSVDIQEGQTFENSSISIPLSTYSDYELNGWFDSNDNQLTTTTQIMNNITYTASWSTSNYTRAGTEVYYDPVSSTTCSSSTFSPTLIANGSSTCYKWNIIKETEYNAVIQLDHNISSNEVWNYSGSVMGPVDPLTDLATATSSWGRVSNLTYVYDTSSFSNNYGILSCTSGTCNIVKNNVINATISNVKARLITAEEVNAIARIYSNGDSNIDNWTPSSTYGYTLPTDLSWLVANTTTSYNGSSAGATSSVYGDDAIGYWTLSPGYPSNRAGAITRLRTYGYPFASGDAGAGGLSYGTRPVITVPKSDLN